MWRTVIKGVIATMFASAPALAQTGTITGRVTAADGGTPLPRVQVTLSGGGGAVTRDDGGYTIVARPGTYKVFASRVGLARDSVSGVTVTSGAATTVNFHMRAAAAALTGVVVIGYGTEQARDVTGSIARVDSSQFNQGRIVSPEALIRGKVAGVQVSENNEPGGGLSVRIRGGTSETASNEPLYVIDGVPIDIGGGSTVSGRNPLNFLNPNDIESVTVLKDASSTAIYGNRGANGVVMITTRQGGSGPQLSYTGTVSGSKVTGGPSFLTADQYRAAVTAHNPANVAVLGSANTDWLAAIEQQASGQEHNLAFSGRRENSTYRLGLGYLDQDGVLIGSRTQRESASLNYNDLLLNDRLALRTHVRGSRSLDWYTPGSVLGEAIAFAPTQPIYTSSGAYYQYRDPNTGALVGLAPNNPLEDLKYVQDQGNILRSIGNVELEYQVPFLAGLSTTLRGSYDINRADRYNFTPTNIASQLKADSLHRGSVSRANHEELHNVLDFFGNYRHDLAMVANSNIDLTAGVSAEDFNGSYNGYGSSGLSNNLLGVNGDPNPYVTNAGVSVQEHKLRSAFGRGNVSLLDRYLFTATVREDGSSRFGEGLKYGTFPSVAFAWRLLQEPMLKDKLPLSDLKFRLSWGRNGNEAIGCNYCAYESYQVGGPQAQVQFGNEFVSTLRPVAFDPNLHWETTASTNAGLDLGIMNDRFTGSIDVYTKKTTDLLFYVPVAAGTSLSNGLLTNIGSVRNRGVEFQIDGNLFQGGRHGFNWNANFNASHNSNELLTLGRGSVTNISTGGVAGGVGTNVQTLQVGLPINSFYVYQHRESGGKVVTTGPDTAMFVDQNKDGVINTSDLRPFHDPAPKWIFGHTSNITWNGWDASTTIRAYRGNYVYNNVASNQGNYSVLNSAYMPTNLSSSVLNYGYTSAEYLSDVYVEDASFIRMDNLTVGYTFDRLGQVSNARLFGTIQNVFTTTNYTGVDPTANINGLDNNVYPRSRTFVGGLSVGF